MFKYLWGDFMYDRIRNLREDMDLSQKEMAAILNVAQTTYSDYELGKINIPIEVLKRMSIFFKRSIDYLLDMSDDDTPPKRKV